MEQYYYKLLNGMCRGFKQAIILYFPNVLHFINSMCIIMFANMTTELLYRLEHELDRTNKAWEMKLTIMQRK